MSAALSALGVEAVALDGGGCELRYQATTPDATSTDGTVLLLHGFLRNHDRFADWSSHLATWGIPSVAVTMCHSAVWDNDADANAADVLELVDHLQNHIWMLQW